MKIIEIHLHCHDLPQTEYFYQQVLGLTLANKTAESLTFEVGDGKIIFLKTAEECPNYHFTFTIPCNQLAEAMEWAAKKVKILEIEDEGFIADFPNWNAKSFYFYDNNGNILECIARFDLKNESEKVFSSESLLGISEVAIVTDNVVELSEKLRARTQLPFFSKQIQREDFRAFGDDEGLLLLSKSTRNWFPTKIRAQKCYVKAKFLAEGKLIEVEENATFDEK